MADVIDGAAAEVTVLKQHVVDMQRVHAVNTMAFRHEYESTVSKLRQSCRSLRERNSQLLSNISTQQQRLVIQRHQHAVSKSDLRQGHTRYVSQLEKEHEQRVMSLQVEHQCGMSSLHAAHSREIHGSPSVYDVIRDLDSSRTTEQSTLKVLQALSSADRVQSAFKHIIQDRQPHDQVRVKREWHVARARARSRRSQAILHPIRSFWERLHKPAGVEPSALVAEGADTHIPCEDECDVTPPAMYMADLDRGACTVCGEAGRGGILTTCHHALCEGCVRRMVFTTGRLCVPCPAYRTHNDMCDVP